MKRSEVKREHTWALELMFENDEKWQKAFEAASKKTGDLLKYRGKLGDKKELLKCFRESTAIQREMDVISLYAHLKKEENTADTKYQGMDAQSSQMYAELGANASWITPELAALPDSYLKELIADKDFADYDYDIKEILRNRPHILSDKEERLLAEAGTPLGEFYDVFQRLENADMKFGAVKTADGKDYPITHGTYSLALQNKDRELREKVFKQYYSVFNDHINTLAAALSGNTKKDLFFAKARGFKSCMERSMFAEHVTPEVYKNLLKAVGENTKHLHKYMAYRKKQLGYNEMHMWDLHVPIVEDADIAMPYAEATKVVKEALKPLGAEYQELLRQSFEDRWIDVYETENKRAGAFQSSVYDTKPYVLLNYVETTHDIFTIAHELGHAMHSWYSKHNQPYEKSGYKIFVAEVASTVNEVFLLKHLLKTEKDAKIRKYLMTYYLDMFRTTIFRQTMFAEFEYILHLLAEENKPITHVSLSEKYYELNKKYYGDAVTHDDQIKIEWCRIPHFYYNFYVYKYATGLISAVSIAEGILADTTGKKLKDYTAFLKSGGSDSPVELLKIAGVDLTKAAPFESAFKSFENTLSELEKMK